jgi:hypothetical protein
MYVFTTRKCISLPHVNVVNMHARALTHRSSTKQLFKQSIQTSLQSIQQTRKDREAQEISSKPNNASIHALSEQDEEAQDPYELPEVLRARSLASACMRAREWVSECESCL